MCGQDREATCVPEGVGSGAEYSDEAREINSVRLGHPASCVVKVA